MKQNINSNLEGGWGVRAATLRKAKNVSEYISEYVSEYTSKYVSEYTSEAPTAATAE